MSTDHNSPSPSTEGRPPLETYEALACMVDHVMLRPNLTDEAVHDGCVMARNYGVAAAYVQPSNADLAVRVLQGSPVLPGSVVGFPHGGATTPVKLFETRDLLRRGVREIELVVNIGKLVSRQFQHIESEVLQAANACHESGARLKVIFENAYLTDDLKVIACKICKRAEADFVATSTGFASSGYTQHDLELLKRIAKDVCQVKVSDGLRTLDSLLDAYALGAERFGLAHTSEILDEWKARLAARQAQAAQPPSAPES